MTQYLLSIYQPDGPPPAPEVLDPIMRNLDALNREMKDAGVRRDQPGPYQIQAAINAVHCDAPTASDTDWEQILKLYDHLLALTPTPIVALNRAVAVAEVEGPQAALDLVDELDLDGYHAFHVVRADLLRRLGRQHDAAGAYDAAIIRTGNAAEREFLRRRREDLS